MLSNPIRVLHVSYSKYNFSYRLCNNRSKQMLCCLRNKNDGNISRHITILAKATISCPPRDLAQRNRYSWITTLNIQLYMYFKY